MGLLDYAASMAFIGIFGGASKWYFTIGACAPTKEELRDDAIRASSPLVKNGVYDQENRKS